MAFAVKSATPLPPSSACTSICGAVTWPPMNAWLLWLVMFAAAATPSAIAESTASPVASASASLSIVAVTATAPPAVMLAPVSDAGERGVEVEVGRDRRGRADRAVAGAEPSGRDQVAHRDGHARLQRVQIVDVRRWARGRSR